MRAIRFQPCVYVISGRDGRVKVGVSALVARRLVQLIAKEGEPLAISGKVDTPSMWLARRVEAEAHERMAVSRMDGEWFGVTRAHAVSVIQESHSHVTAAIDVEAKTEHADRVRASQAQDTALITAARMMLGWRMADLAAASGLSEASIKNIERGVTDPRSSTLRKIWRAFDAAGVQAVRAGEDGPGGKGVRLKD